MIWINLPIDISINDIDKFEKKELTKKRIFTKNTWYDGRCWFHQLRVGGFKDQIMNLCKTKDYSQPERVKTVYGCEKEQDTY